MKIKLTQSSVENVVVRERRYMITFFGYPGLGMLVHPSGKKVFVFDYSIKGKRKRMTIGPVGAVSLTRGEGSIFKRYGSAVALATMGVDPVAPKETEQMTFSELVREYVESIKLHRKNPRMDINYLDRAKSVWGHLPLGDITRKMVVDFRNNLSENGQHNQTANKARVAVCTCFNYAINMGYATENPATKIKDLPTSGARTRVFTEEEMGKLIHALEHEDKHTQALFHLMIETGCRQSEALSASWGDFNLLDGLWTIPASKSKSGRTDVIPIPESIIRMLWDLEPGDQSDPVIPSPKREGRHRGQLHSTWDRIRKAAGLPDDLNMHDIRRTFGLRVCLQSGIHVASRLLRHSSIKITEQVYAPLGVDVRGVTALRQAVNGVSIVAY